MSTILDNLQERLQVQESNGGMFSWAEVDPVLAKDLLSLSKGNRPISTSSVNKYARHMEQGSWNTDTPTQFIMFDTEGVLINGHHTLRAVMKSGCTIKLYFMFNVAKHPYIDSGRQRSEADRFALTYDMRSSHSYRRAVAVCNVLTMFGLTRLVTEQERFDFINKNIQEFNLLSEMRGLAGTGLSTTPVYAAIFAAAKSGANQADLMHFWQVLQDGCIREDNDKTIIALRDWLKERPNRHSNAYRKTVLYTVTKYIAHWMNHSKVIRNIAEAEEMIVPSLPGI